MDNRAVLIFLCMLCAQASCKPAERDEATRASIKIVLQDVRGLLHQLGLSGLLPNNCSILKHQPLSALNFSSISCYMQKFSQLPQIHELSEKLMINVQIIQDAERRLFNSTTPTNCSLPAFEQEVDAPKFAGCFLQLVEKELSS